MAGASFRLDNLVALIDCNGIQADGAVVLDMEPVAEKWRAFGWDTQEIDGNDIGAIVDALHAGARRRAAGPKAIVLRTLPGKGVPTLEQPREGAFRPRRSRRVGRARGRAGARSAAPWLSAAAPWRWARTRRPSGGRAVRRSAVRPRARRARRDRARRSSGSPPTSANTPTSCRSATPSPTASSTSAWPSRTSSPSPPGSRAPGRIAYCTTYGVFATRRAYDFIAIACAHSAVNVKIFAGLPGLTTGYGGTHQAIEDLGADAHDPGPRRHRPVRRHRDRAGDARRSPTIPGPVYVRLLRGNVPVVLDPATYRFEIGRAQRLRERRRRRHRRRPAS